MKNGKRFKIKMPEKKTSGWGKGKHEKAAALQNIIKFNNVISPTNMPTKNTSSNVPAA